MMSPAGGRHGQVTHNIQRLLGNHIHATRLGRVFAAETGFRIGSDPDTVRAPVAAFVSNTKLDEVENLSGYLPVAPDLAVEVVSPNDKSSDVESKAEMWIQSGCQLCLVVDPENQTIRVYRNTRVIEVLHLDDSLEADDMVEGWQVAVAEIFA